MSSAEKLDPTAGTSLDGKLREQTGAEWGGWWLGRLSFWEATPLVRLGAQRSLAHSDLRRLPPNMQAYYNWKAFSRHWKEELNLPNDQVSMFRAMRRTYAFEFCLAVALQFVYAVLSFATSVLMPYMMVWLSGTGPAWEGYLYLLDILLATILGSLCTYHSQFIGWRLGVKIRAAMTAVAYKKALALGSTKTRNTGHVVNLIASDAQLITETLPWFLQGFIAPFQIVAATGLLWRELGAYALLPLAVFIVTMPISAIIGFRIGKHRDRAQKNGDERLKLLREVLVGIRIVKFMAWEPAFAQNIDRARLKEVYHNKQLFLWQSFMIGVMTFVPDVGIGVTLFGYSFPVPNFASANIFTALSLMSLIRMPFSFLPFMLTLGSQYGVTFKRMCEFLLQPEVPKRKELPLTKTPVALRGATFAWNSGDPPVLSHLDLKIPAGSLYMVVGSVGAGKSSLLQSMLGETVLTEGKASLTGTVAYVAQEAWIINATVRANVTFGKAWDEKLYKKAVHAAALLPDFEIMPSGDLTEIGDKGINLSGGQRQRVSIARALYADREVYLLDDPLSAVDTHVSVHIMQHAILGFLRKRKKTVMLALNQIQFLAWADRIVVLKHNTISERGTYKELVEAKGDFARILADFGLGHDPKASHPKALPSASLSEPGKSVHIQESTAEALAKGNLTGTEELEVGFIGARSYLNYIHSGGWALFLLSLLFLAISFGSQVFYSIWLAEWTNPDKAPLRSLEVWRSVFLAASCAQGVFLLIKGVFSTYFARGASLRLHRTLLASILRAGTNFFDQTPLGRLVNRFAKDFAAIDQLLPFQFDTFFTTLFQLLAMFAQLAATSPYLIIGIFVIGVAYILCLHYYRHTAISIQRLDAVTRSPIFSHLSETLEGGATIRAFGLGRAFKVENFNRIDHNSIAFYNLRYCGVWFGLRLDWLGTLVILGVVLAVVLLRNFNPQALDVSLAGLALSATNGLTLMLTYLSMNFEEMEVKMNSVERVEEYSAVVSEAPTHRQDTLPPQPWPTKGAIHFKHLSIAYGNHPPVLKDITLKIRGREKIGLVGRTGSGKSTLVTALFRLVEPCGGQIKIDGVSIGSLGLTDLRTKLSIIPQSPTLFLGSVRYNIDPFGEVDDNTIWKALERVQLKGIIEAMPGQLSAAVEENGQNFSVGQRQLLTLARALVRDAPILLLDESTASLSNDSDAMIQLMIRRNFQDKTIITIAHRLNTIMDADRVIVLDRGVVAEFDTPKRLLDIPNGIFAGMVEATGKGAEHLRKIARGEISPLKELEDEILASTERETTARHPRLIETPEKSD